MNAIAPIDDLNARLLAQMDAFEASQVTKFTEFFRFKASGDYIVRFYPSQGWPNDINWFRQFGRHGIKPAPGVQAKTVMFGCVSHAFGQACPVCEAQRTHKDSADAILAKIADDAYASKRYMVNGQIFDLATRQFGPVIPFELTKGQFDELKPVMRMVNPRFFDPEVGHILHLKVTPRVQGAGFDIKVMKAEGPHNSGVTAAQLYDLDALLKKEYYEGGMKPVTAFSGNFLAPLAAAAATEGLTAIGGGTTVLGGALAMLPAPGLQTLPVTGGVSVLGATPAAQPVANVLQATPVAQPAIDYAALATQTAVMPTVAVAQPAVADLSVLAVTQPAPVAQPVAQPVVQPMAQPVVQPAVAVQPAAPQPAAPLAAAEVDDLEAKLLALVS